MANCLSHRRLIAFCVLIILLSLAGHFLADSTGVSLDARLSVDLHSSFDFTSPASLAVSLAATTVLALIHGRAVSWHPPPMTPPPIVTR
jgi:hypothetical protein